MDRRELIFTHTKERETTELTDSPDPTSAPLPESPATSRFPLCNDEIVLHGNVEARGSNFIVDTGCTTHVVCSDEYSREFIGAEFSSETIMMNKHPAPIVMRGDLNVNMTDSKSGETKMVLLKNVAYVPESHYNLLSVTKFLDDRTEQKGRATVKFSTTSTTLPLGPKQNHVVRGAREGKLYVLQAAPADANTQLPHESAASPAPPLQLPNRMIGRPLL